jgi:uncharacterized membrane protein YczE
VRTDWVNRLVRCVSGLGCFGVGISLILRAHLGAAPWDVFHQGLAAKTGISVGIIIVIVGLALLLVWIPLGQRPGIGTLLNALEIGLLVDLILRVVPSSRLLAVRIPELAGGVVVIALGSALYIGSGLGAGPRDGLMMGLRDRGLPVAPVRTAIEAAVLLAGVALGGRVGVGTVVFTLAIGPLVARLLPWFNLPPRRPAQPAAAAEPAPA